MTVHNRKAFISAIRPFDRLSEPELERVIASMNILFFADETLIMKAGGGVPEYLYLLFKGTVREEEGDDVVAYYGAGEAFDASSLISGVCRHDFVVVEECFCYTLERSLFLELARSNRAFQDYYFQNLSQKVDELRQIRGLRDLDLLMTGHVRDVGLRPAITLDGHESIQSAAQLMKQKDVDVLLVRLSGARQALVTGTDIRDAVAGECISPATAVEQIAQRGIKGAGLDDELFDVLLAMTGRQTTRLLIESSEQPAGFLELVDVLGFWSNQSLLVGGRIEHAETIEELRQVVERLPFAIQTLFVKGVKVRRLARLMRELNQRLLTRLFALLAPPELAANSALIVMGSEGRGEQLIKTDQDNALILKNGFAYPQLESFRQSLADAMATLGIPACPGKIMASEQGWCGSIQFFQERIRCWIDEGDPEQQMNLAILLDASHSAGNRRLLPQVKKYLFDALPDDLAFYARFARPTVTFDTPLGLFSQFVLETQGDTAALDIKKGGVFPIVHGVRSLALEKRLHEVNTIQRINALADGGLFEASFADDLVEAFDFLSATRFQSMLARKQGGVVGNNMVDPDRYSSQQRELLKESLRMVDRLKKMVTQHFRLDLMG
ncbi:MAG: cyclic nucleotide-binding domain-containing protein [Magnetococcales bacterium]|nr:cyclic nucleotide-binding domain-containing protein [Magnetococcales bacterium]